MSKVQDYFKLKQQRPDIAAKLQEAVTQRPIQRKLSSLAVADACYVIGHHWRMRQSQGAA